MLYWAQVPPAHESLAGIMRGLMGEAGQPQPKRTSTPDEMRGFVERFQSGRAP